MAISTETTTEVTYRCTIGRTVFCKETGTLYFPAAFNKTHTPECVRELAGMLNSIAVEMEAADGH